MIYHEPCYLGRHNGEYEAPRRALAAACSDAPLEFALTRDKAMCCGAGGAPDVDGRKDRPSHQRDARRAGANPFADDVIATACPYCAVMMGDGIAALGQAGNVKTRDIAELVGESLAAD